MSWLKNETRTQSAQNALSDKQRTEHEQKAYDLVIFKFSLKHS